MLAGASGPAEAAHTLRVIGEVLLLLLHDLGQLFRYICFDVFDQEFGHVHFLVHDCNTSFIVIASRDERREENILQLFVHEVCKGQIAQLLKNGILSSLQSFLVGLVQ